MYVLLVKLHLVLTRSYSASPKLQFLSQLAQQNAKCDYALFMGASSTNAKTAPALAHLTAGLKMYLNETFTSLKLDDFNVWAEVTLRYRVYFKFL